jgi:hypothetical protein
MIKDNNLLEKFEQLDSIEPSTEWTDRLMYRMDQIDKKPAVLPGSKMVLYAILLLLLVNIISFSKSWLNERSQQNSLNMKNIASEYLISTNSSKYQ